LVKFFVTLYVIRLLGSYEYGKFAFAFAFVSLFSTLFDFGLSPVVTREFAKDQKQELSFSAILGLKVAIGLIVLTFIGVNGYLMSPDQTVRKMVLVLALTLWLSELGSTYYAYFRSRQRMEYESSLGILGSLVFGLSGAM